MHSTDLLTIAACLVPDDQRIPTAQRMAASSARESLLNVAADDYIVRCMAVLAERPRGAVAAVVQLVGLADNAAVLLAEQLRSPLIVPNSSAEEERPRDRCSARRCLRAVLMFYSAHNGAPATQFAVYDAMRRHALSPNSFA